jgi:hypothetical protein
MEHSTYGTGFDAIDDDSAEGAALRAELGKSLDRDLSQMLVSPGLQLGYRYDPSPICVPDGTPAPPDEPGDYVAVARPGSRAPHGWIDEGKARSTLDLFGRGFVLLRLGENAPETTEIGAAAAARGVPLEVVSLPSRDIADLYQGRLVLVRPDGHVAWRSDDPPDDAAALIDRVRGAL